MYIFDKNTSIACILFFLFLSLQHIKNKEMRSINLKYIIRKNAAYDVDINSVSKVLGVSVNDIIHILQDTGSIIKDNGRLNETHLEILSYKYAQGLKRYYSKIQKNIQKLNETEISDFENFKSFYTDSLQNHLLDSEEGIWGGQNQIIAYNKYFENIQGLLAVSDKMLDLDLIKASIEKLQRYCNPSLIEIVEDDCNLLSQDDSCKDQEKELDSEDLRLSFYDLLEEEGIIAPLSFQSLNDISSLPSDFFELLKKIRAERKSVLINIIKHRFFKIRKKVKSNYDVILSIMTFIIISFRYYIFSSDNEVEDSKELCNTLLLNNY